MTIAICGGAGYIGSHAVLALLDRGTDVIVIDNLSTGHAESVPAGVKLYKGDIRDGKFLDTVFTTEKITAVMHFAADSLVGVSVKEPLTYYNNNVGGAITLLEAMKRHNINNIVFSSTAATFGEPLRQPIVETDAQIPTNPYGETKLAIEKLLKWTANSSDLRYKVLRYFNVAGADPAGRAGEDHRPESHLIPLVLEVALGNREHISIFGDTYPTEDGTCVRDYIHVSDLIAAHILALDDLFADGENSAYNLGNGQGFSVKEVIEVCRKVTGHVIPEVIAPIRLGDPATLIASSDKAKQQLGWSPQHAKLETIVADAWHWFEKNPNAY
ncbi:UDP-glucose 4-epimerase GalE [Brochothrix thermosphacta]|uniref:UDP-glucose 4-epimerase GalE n=1 Tax=Brochothrix thermosphacta TaxID=2756 RepID=UPI00083FCA32|nr:UDP-glucose 4-epimerase GalE [Brochothrix thermosphacta]ODJ56031.1 UDP-glucose 4-epimerase GalE [Brochothrix thermosphacta]ODJ71032.1 UDP-glucose 4-epimerase GalE [Brochothrix thermosphacta]